ncbi:PREDICTED: uncharacterized protein LOC106744657, partial [Dinoponera quadriceps]|uniref:Uncharacterized protein LOC106744657 n=1 Tax=Dinoponera quadriceps TaxID=609295 RepID=A0A6P3XB14_DINQU
MCNVLALTVNLHIQFIEQIERMEKYEFHRFPFENKLFTDMSTFHKQYFQGNISRNYWTYADYAFTDFVTGPLTLLHSLQCVNLVKPIKELHTYVIHIIDAKYVDRYNFPSWELFLHFIRRNGKLIIVMVGLELPDETSNSEICRICVNSGKKLVLESVHMLYHDYVTSSAYRRPTIVIGFHAELKYLDARRKYLEAIRAQNCSLLLTSKSKIKMEEHLTEIRDVLGEFVKPLLETENKFRSHRPYRDFDTNYVFYRNAFLIIYKNLHNSNMSKKCALITYRGPCSSATYNNFFHAYLCHVCKLPNQGKLQLCNGCNMIAYCNDHHRTMHLVEHKYICQAIQKIRHKNLLCNVPRTPLQEFFNSKNKSITALSEALGRKLCDYEMEMIVWARLCNKCEQHEKLFTCPVCYSVSYCDNHKGEIDKHYGIECENLALSVNYAIKYMDRSGQRETYKFDQFFDTNKWNFTDMGATFPSVYNCPSWELFLHLLGKRCKLLIVLIGSNVPLQGLDFSICSCCEQSGKTVVFETYQMMYQDYVASPVYKQPSLVILLDFEFKYDVSDKMCLMAIRTQNCPLIITAKSQTKVQDHLFLVQQHIDVS